MAKDNFASKFEIASDDLVAPHFFNDAGDGVQAEFEARMLAEGMVAGFVPGGSAPTLSGTTAVSLPAQTGYASGRRFTASALFTFAAQANGDYLVYLDASAESLAVTTGAVDCGADLLVAEAMWAAPTLSALVDKRLFGLLPQLWTGFVPGTLAASTVAAVDRRLIPSGYKFQFDEDCLCCAVAAPGSANTTAVDVHAGPAGSAPATIFTTQTRRATLTSGTATLAAVAAGAPQANRLLTGPALVEIYVDTVATDSVGLSWSIKGRMFPA